ncbi:hypothetical protein MJO28_012855 [Puccinia striiformis f. sp. tritici]|uniref:Uncharacterized protein n=1 Tax=Puccinia striiformis f. sp. tritici TaxID=168172 RepID=A0ACC0DXW6_9BASI|nr:hypothetical protein MJO28_012855 [Puccinia striiformis f. sp. tritici]
MFTPIHPGMLSPEAHAFMPIPANLLDTVHDPLLAPSFTTPPGTVMGLPVTASPISTGVVPPAQMEQVHQILSPGAAHVYMTPFIPAPSIGLPHLPPVSHPFPTIIAGALPTPQLQTIIPGALPTHQVLTTMSGAVPLAQHLLPPAMASVPHPFLAPITIPSYSPAMPFGPPLPPGATHLPILGSSGFPKHSPELPNSRGNSGSPSDHVTRRQRSQINNRVRSDSNSRGSLNVNQVLEKQENLEKKIMSNTGPISPSQNSPDAVDKIVPKKKARWSAKARRLYKQRTSGDVKNTGISEGHGESSEGSPIERQLGTQRTALTGSLGDLTHDLVSREESNGPIITVTPEEPDVVRLGEDLKTKTKLDIEEPLASKNDDGVIKKKMDKDESKVEKDGGDEGKEKR